MPLLALLSSEQREVAIECLVQLPQQVNLVEDQKEGGLMGTEAHKVDVSRIKVEGAIGGTLAPRSSPAAVPS